MMNDKEKILSTYIDSLNEEKKPKKKKESRESLEIKLDPMSRTL